MAAQARRPLHDEQPEEADEKSTISSKSSQDRQRLVARLADLLEADLAAHPPKE